MALSPHTQLVELLEQAQELAEDLRPDPRAVSMTDLLDQLQWLQARVTQLQEGSRAGVREIQAEARETILVALSARWEQLYKQYETQVKAGYDAESAKHYLNAIRQCQSIIKEVEL